MFAGYCIAEGYNHYIWYDFLGKHGSFRFSSKDGIHIEEGLGRGFKDTSLLVLAKASEKWRFFVFAREISERIDFITFSHKADACFWDSAFFSLQVYVMTNFKMPYF